MPFGYSGEMSSRAIAFRTYASFAVVWGLWILYNADVKFLGKVSIGIILLTSSYGLLSLSLGRIQISLGGIRSKRKNPDENEVSFVSDETPP